MVKFRFPEEACKTSAKDGGNGTDPIHPRITFKSYNWLKAKPTEKDTKLHETAATSVTTLYMPNNFSEKYGASWGEQDLVMSVANLGGQGLSIQGIQQAGKDFAEGLKTDVVSALVKSGQEMGLSGIVNSGLYAGGVTAFPGQFNVFQKADPMQLDFTFDLIPSNAKEATIIMNIVNNFKRKLLPEYGKGNFVSQYMLQFPDVWSIHFSGANGIGFPDEFDEISNFKSKSKEDNTELKTYKKGKFKDMALVSCNATYGGGANSSLTFFDGNPVIVTLALGFKGIKHSYVHAKEKS